MPAHFIIREFNYLIIVAHLPDIIYNNNLITNWGAHRDIGIQIRNLKYPYHGFKKTLTGVFNSKR
jgi:hypothetical protein